MKLHFRSVARGCTSSLFEVALYRKAVGKLGHEVTDDIEIADVVVLNTCGFTSDLEIEALRVFDELTVLYPNKKVVVGGCLPKINPEELRKHYSGPVFHPERVDELIAAIGLDATPNLPFSLSDLFRETHQIHNADVRHLSLVFRVFGYLRKYYTMIRRWLPFQNPYLDNFFKSATINENNYLIIAARGCLGSCTYCAIRKARGRLISTPLSSIITDLEQAARSGQRDVVLCAEDLGAWGQDIGTDVSVLFKALAEMRNDLSLLIPFFEPSWFLRYFDRLETALMDPRFAFLYVPFHSGSTRILKKMGRHYSTSALVVKVRALKKLNKHLFVKTNMMHSFPGETWGDFMLSLYYGCFFDFTLPIAFTPRPGTPAAAFPDQIGVRDKCLRSWIAGFVFWSMNFYKFSKNAFLGFSKWNY